MNEHNGKEPPRRKKWRKPKVEKSQSQPVHAIVSDLVSNLECLKDSPTSEKKEVSNEKLEKQKQKNKARREKKKLFKSTGEPVEKKLEFIPKYSAFSKIKYDTEEVVESRKPIDKSSIKGHTGLTEKLISALSDETYECMICVGKVKKTQAIWTCQCCSASFHIACMKKWFKGNQSSDSGTLVCPQCRDETAGIPNKYLCFCGKVKDPELSPYLTPHSCGNICEKVRKGTDCPHACNLLCHPGKCPPCPSNRTIACFCGKKDFTIRCSDSTRGISCEDVCDKILSCGKHKCESKCHAGVCQPCTKTFEEDCYCGKEEKVVKICSNTKEQTINGKKSSFSCGKVCNHELNCKNHKCEENCHLGSCKPCPYGVETLLTCACGKKQMPKRKSCLDPISTCGMTCGKVLGCGLHKCLKKCHDGPCGHCLELRETPCRCSSTTTKVPCLLMYASSTDPFVIEIKKQYKLSWPVLCDRVCSVTKNCTRHKCKTKCCPSRKDHTGGTLTNRIHYSGSHICHLPCGKKLNCGKHTCDVPCHPGPCEPCHMVLNERITCKCGKTHLDPPQHCGTKVPVCKFPCSIRRQCGHATKHPCHESGPCPPCSEIVSKPCQGGHQLVDKVPCCASDLSCTSSCGKDVGCGLHKCDKVCHAGKCLQDPEPTVNGCGQPCLKILPCKHACIEKCHPTSDCQQVCHQKVKIYCECRHISTSKDCDELKKMVKSQFPEIEYNTQAVPPVLDCNSECRLLARNKKLAEAFNIDVIKHDLPVYSKSLVSFAVKNPKFVVETEHIFATFLENPNATKYSYPSMSPDKRSFVHDLAGHYGLLAETVDRKPFKSTVLIKTTKCETPLIRLSVVISDRSKLKILEEKLSQITIQQNQEPQSRTYQKKMQEQKLRELEGEDDSQDDDFPEEEDDGWETVQSKETEGEARRLKKPPTEVKSDNIWDKLDK